MKPQSIPPKALRILRGKIARAQKGTIYGPEGVGKTTLASQLPSPIFLDTEGGTHHLDVDRIDAGASWDEIIAAITLLANESHGYRTLVIDTADWLEKRLIDHLCRKANKESIEDFGYGKGWVLLAEEFARFLASLDVLLARGMHVVFLAHAMVRKFEAPDQAGSYDRFELKLSKQVAPLLKEWADVLLFANFITKVAEKDNGKLRGVGGKERALFANHSAAYDAKNRHGLPDKLTFSIEALAPVFGGVSGEAEVAKPAEPEQTLSERIATAFAGKAETETIARFLVDRSQLALTEDGTIESFDRLDAAYAARMLAEPDRFVGAINQWLQEREEVAATS